MLARAKLRGGLVGWDVGLCRFVSVCICVCCCCCCHCCCCCCDALRARARTHAREECAEHFSSALLLVSQIVSRNSPLQTVASCVCARENVRCSCVQHQQQQQHHKRTTSTAQHRSVFSRRVQESVCLYVYALACVYVHASVCLNEHTRASVCLAFESSSSFHSLSRLY